MGNKNRLAEMMKNKTLKTWKTLKTFTALAFLSAFFCNLFYESALADMFLPKRPPLEKRKQNYIELNDLNLNENQLEAFSVIREYEAAALRPIVLELEARYQRFDELKAQKCRFYQRQCKKELKENKLLIFNEIKELKRQIRLKKEYYKILYINRTTRAQHTKLRKIINSKTRSNPKMW